MIAERLHLEIKKKSRGKRSVFYWEKLIAFSDFCQLGLRISLVCYAEARELGGYEKFHRVLSPSGN